MSEDRVRPTEAMQCVICEALCVYYRFDVQTDAKVFSRTLEPVPSKNRGYACRECSSFVCEPCTEQAKMYSHSPGRWGSAPCPKCSKPFLLSKDRFVRCDDPSIREILQKSQRGEGFIVEELLDFADKLPLFMVLAFGTMGLKSLASGNISGLQRLILMAMLTAPVRILTHSRRHVGRPAWGWAVFGSLAALGATPVISSLIPAAMNSSAGLGTLVGSIFGAWSVIFGIYNSMAIKAKDMAD